MYIDIAIAYGILGFVGNIVIARYVQKYHNKEEKKNETSVTAKEKSTCAVNGALNNTLEGGSNNASNS